VVARVLPKFLIDEPEMLFYQCDRPCADALKVEVFFKQQKQLEQRGGFLYKHFFVRGFQIAASLLKPWPERCDRRTGIAENRLFEQLQQHLVETTYLHHRAVIALHELFDTERI